MLPYQVVEAVDDAEFLLAHGAECLGRPGNAEPREASLDEIRAVLKAGAKKGLPLLVANPDIVTVSGSGLITMPGTFGRWYKEMGGQVCASHWCERGKAFHQRPMCSAQRLPEWPECYEIDKSLHCCIGSISTSCCFNQCACLPMSSCLVKARRAMQCVRKLTANTVHKAT